MLRGCEPAGTFSCPCCDADSFSCRFSLQLKKLLLSPSHVPPSCEAQRDGSARRPGTPKSRPPRPCTKVLPRRAELEPTLCPPLRSRPREHNRRTVSGSMGSCRAGPGAGDKQGPSPLTQQPGIPIPVCTVGAVRGQQNLQAEKHLDLIWTQGGQACPRFPEHWCVKAPCAPQPTPPR